LRQRVVSPRTWPCCFYPQHTKCSGARASHQFYNHTPPTQGRSSPLVDRPQPNSRSASQQGRQNVPWAKLIFRWQDGVPIAPVDLRLSQSVRLAPLGVPCSELQEHNAPRPGLRMPLRLCFCPQSGYGWIPHNASFGFLDRPHGVLGQIHFLDRL
jgi:hypothetical protein